MIFFFKFFLQCNLFSIHNHFYFFVFEIFKSFLTHPFCSQQDDTLSYINDALKQGNQISCFRKDKIGGDGNGITYW